MPYTKEELENLEFYQELAKKDEVKYLNLIQKRTEAGKISEGVLRDAKSNSILLFEKINPGEGSDGSSYPVHHRLLWERGYFDYEENEELNRIIDREFTEF
jgi:hypothetical protein